jgi:hypothetical protein
MGIDVAGLNHLIHCKQYGDFNKTITLGRQEIHVSTDFIKNVLYTDKNYGGYCENLLIECFGSTHVDSADNSDYEGASVIFNLSKIIGDDIVEKYDTIIDYGTLEHVYNIPNALYNASKLCKVGGQIIHILPANNFCGHGFWQISPELFFSLYSEKNGYEQTEVFIMDTINTNDVKKLNLPVDGNRILIDGQNPIYVAVRTVLSKENFSHLHVQQSDYVYLWSK